MKIFGRNVPEIKKIRNVGKTGIVRSGVVFSVKNGRGSLHLRPFGVKDTKNYDEYMVSRLMLGDTPLAETRSSCCPTCESMIAAGYGIEKADCAQLREISDRVNAGFVSAEKSLETLAPLLGLLKDGVYLLTDAECYPTDGQGGFFWAADPKKKFYDAAVSQMYIGSEDDVYLFSSDVVPPLFLYPTQSADMMNRERVEHYRGVIGQENAPRALALNYADGLSFLIDGHHKAAAAALEGKPVKCLLIIPETLDFTMNRPTSAWKFKRQIFGGAVQFTREQISTAEFAGIIKRWEEKRMYSRNETACPADDIPCRFEQREWETEFLASAENYPIARQLVLEKLFGIADDYYELAAYLEKFVTDKAGLCSFILKDPFGMKKADNKTEAVCTGLKLAFRKGAYNKDRRLRNTAIAAAEAEINYPLTAAALRYLLPFKDDEVESLFIGIISDNDKYERYGQTAADYWEDETD